jgi:3-methylfumaryl-CoA hydratase
MTKLPDIDTTGLGGWIGHSEIQTDLVTPRLVRSFIDTVGLYTPETYDAAVPPGLHWCLTPSIVPASAIGPDGHPARGGFLPPIKLPRRMWAGGRVEFHRPLLTGDTVERRSTIKDIQLKDGKTGQLCFVVVRHELIGPRGVAITEEQDIVYRDFGGVAATPPREDKSVTAANAREIAVNTALLFRYSALTFNSHRIHYDRPYATEVEGYAGLLVHGPLQATLLMDLARRMRPEAMLSRFSFRSVAPLFDLASFFARGRILEDGSASLWVAGAKATVHMRAEANWTPV